MDWALLSAEAAGIARAAPSPNTGWALLCALAERTVGPRAVAGVRELDLADDALDLRPILVELRRQERIPRRVDTLAFIAFDGPGADDRPATGLRVVGAHGFHPGRLGELLWQPQNGTVFLEALTAIHRAALRSRAARARRMLDDPLRLGAAGLVARFAAQDYRQRLVVGFDEDSALEVRGAKPPAR